MTWMDLEGLTLHDVSHLEKDEYCIISSICLSEEQNISTKQKWTH